MSAQRAPKLKVKPTPLQARLLLALYRCEGMAIDERNRYGRLVNKSAEWRVAQVAHEMLGGNPKLSTIRSCKKEGWLAFPTMWSNWMELTEEGRAVAETLVDEDMTLAPKEGYTARQIVEILRDKHPKSAWVFVGELRLSSGYGNIGYDLPGHQFRIGGDQRIDAFAMHCWPSKKFKRIGYEIKVDRQDFLNELKHPDKRLAAELFTNLTYFVAPVGIIKPEEVPDGWGLIEVQGDMTQIVSEAIWRDAGHQLPLSFVASLGRSLSYD